MCIDKQYKTTIEKPFFTEIELKIYLYVMHGNNENNGYNLDNVMGTDKQRALLRQIRTIPIEQLESLKPQIEALIEDVKQHVALAIDCATISVYIARLKESLNKGSVLIAKEEFGIRNQRFFDIKDAGFELLTGEEQGILSRSGNNGNKNVPKGAASNSIFNAISKSGNDKNFSAEIDEEQFDETRYMPGTQGKLDTLAERARLGLPLWHPKDRVDLDD